MAKYISGFLVGLGSGTAGIWMQMGHTTLAVSALAIALVGVIAGLATIGGKTKAAA